MTEHLHRRGSLSRTLGRWETVILGVALLGPSSTVTITPAIMAKSAGAAGPLVFLAGGAVVLLIALSFYKFTRSFAHAGSIYAYNTKALGPRYGFVSAWLLLGVYVAFAAAIWGQIGDYARVWLPAIGLSDVPWWIPGLLAAAIVWLFAYRRLSFSTRVMLVIEISTILLIAIVGGAILGTGGASGISLKPFTPSGDSVNTLGLSMVFAFFAYAGFEASATLGEESRNPRHYVPIGLVGTVLFATLWYAFMSWVMTLGYGMNHIQSFASASSPLAYLGNRFVGQPMGTLIYAGATLSVFAAGLACVDGAARVAFSLGRSGLAPKLASVSPRQGSPANAVAGVAVIAGVIAGMLAGFTTASGATVFEWVGTVGSLLIIGAYVMTVFASLVYFKRTRQWKGAILAVPVLACIALGYVLFSSVYPVPSFPENIAPYIALAWLAAGVGVAFFDRPLMGAVRGEFAHLTDLARNTAHTVSAASATQSALQAEQIENARAPRGSVAPDDHV